MGLGKRGKVERNQEELAWSTSGTADGAFPHHDHAANPLVSYTADTHVNSNQYIIDLAMMELTGDLVG